MIARNNRGETALNICQQLNNQRGVQLLFTYTTELDNTRVLANSLLDDLCQEEEKEQLIKNKKKLKKYRNKMNKLAKHMKMTPHELEERLEKEDQNQECMICLISIDSIKQKV